MERKEESHMLSAEEVKYRGRSLPLPTKKRGQGKGGISKGWPKNMVSQKPRADYILTWKEWSTILNADSLRQKNKAFDLSDSIDCCPCSEQFAGVVGIEGIAFGLVRGQERSLSAATIQLR